MSVSDPIADMLTRIRNANRIERNAVNIPASKIKAGIARVLKEEGFIEDFQVVGDDRQGMLRVYMKYGPNGERVIRTIKRESKPGRRVYKKVDEIPSVLGGLGIAIMSTSKGVLSDRRCREIRIGGELLCTVT
jgi:small subunit ribosomal protein S8